MKKIIIYSLAGIAVIVLAYAAYSGFFTFVKVTEKQVGPYFLVIQDHVGSYSDGPKVIAKLDSLLKIEGIKAEKSFGIYRDKPNGNSKKGLRSQFGLILEQKDHDRVLELQRKGFIVFEMGLTNSITTEFPNKNKLSIFAGIMKVYPAFEKYCKDNNYRSEPVLEIYSPGKIQYSMEIKK